MAPLIEFGTKAETLSRLTSVLRTATVLPQTCFTVAEWDASRAAVMTRLGPSLSQPLIVRSSALAEDQGTASLAGRFRSVPAV